MPDITDLIAAQADFLQDLKDATDSLVSLNNRTYGYTHDAVVVDDLEKDYQTIITATPALANVSAVGLLAVLKDGDTVTAQGNLLYINGEEVMNPNGYTFRGTNSQNGIEIVKIWYFENDAIITLQESFSYLLNEVIYHHSSTGFGTPNISNNFLCVPRFTTYGDKMTKNIGDFRANSHYIKTMVFKNNQTCYRNTDNGQEILYSEQTTNINGYTIGIKKSLKEVYMPNLTTIQDGGGTWASPFGVDGSVLSVLYFPNLITIGNAPNASGGNGAFYMIPKVEIPETVMSIGRFACTKNKEVILNCKNATAINNDWCHDTPTVSFLMCSNWGASINISIAANNWTISQFTDLFNNSLRDMTLTNQTRTLTIPSAKLTELQADTDGIAALTAATEKGWTISGA